MTKLENFVGMMTGHFDNKDQFNKMQAGFGHQSDHESFPAA